MGILEQYQKQRKIDKENENNEFPKNSNLNEEQREEYEKLLSDMRNSEEDMENAFHKRMNDMKKMTEDQLTSNDVEVKVKVRRVYCPECGKELIADGPAMYNPFTMTKICKHTCSCGTCFNLEHAYPRLVFEDKEGNEHKAFGE